MDINSLNTKTECEKKIEEAVMRDRARLQEMVSKKIGYLLENNVTRENKDFSLGYKMALIDMLEIINNNHE